MLVGIVASVLTSCEDKNWDDAPAMVDENTESVNEQSLVDEVKTTFEGKVAVLAFGDDNIFGYLQKRTPNVVTSLDSDADVVIFDEVGAANALSNDEAIDQLKTLWYKNKGIAFVNPAANAIRLLNRIREAESSNGISQDAIDAYSDINVYIAKADGNCFYQEKIYNPDKDYVVDFTITEVDSLGNETIRDDSMIVDYTPSDYEWGQVAENIGKWLNQNIVLGENVPDVAFSRSVAEYNEMLDNVVITYSPNVTVSHNLVGDEGYGETPAPKTVTPTVTVLIYPGYNEKMQCDVYDVKITEEFPADKTYVKNKVTKTVNIGLWKYKYKYSGGCYAGPTVDAYLSSDDKTFTFDTNSVILYEPTPIVTPGTYSTTRNPGSLSIGSCLRAGFSGLGATGQVGLSSNYTLPTTSISSDLSEMPVTFSRENAHALWKYTVSKRIYEDDFGFNATYLGPPECTTLNCKTEQGVTFGVNDSEKLGNSKVYLNLKLNFKTYHECCSPWYYNCKKENHYVETRKIELPAVARFFEKYTATYYYMTAYGDGNEWNNVLLKLREDSNFNLLSVSPTGENPPMVSAQTEEGVKKNAERIWEEAINSLVDNSGRSKYANEYVIGLKDSHNNFLSKGLYISRNGTWKIVDDVKSVADSIRNVNK